MYVLRKDGARLSHRCERAGDDTLPADEVRRWHGNVASILERINIEHRRRFYEHSETGESAPDRPIRCHIWIEERLHKLERVIVGLEQPPAQLVPHNVARQIESGATKYFETDTD